MGAPQYSDAFGTVVLQELGAPVTDANLRRLSAWAQEEGTSATYNPFATKQPEPGSTKFNSVGVQNYPTLQEGAAATVKTLTNGLYSGVLAVLRNPDATDAQFAAALGASPWSGGGAKGHAAYGNAIANILRVGPSPAASGSPQIVASGVSSTALDTQAAGNPNCRFATPSFPVVGSICLDRAVGVLAVVGGVLVVLVGAAFVSAYTFRQSGVTKALGGAAGALPGPGGKVAKVVQGSKKSADAAKAAAPKGAEGAGGTNPAAQAKSKAAATKAADQLRDLKPKAGDRSTPGLNTRTAAQTRKAAAAKPGAGKRRAPMTKATYQRATGQPAPF